PNAYTLSSVLTACGRNRIPAFRVGKQAHTQTFLAGLFGNKIVQTTLLDMYGKCGSPDDARSVFDQMVDKDIVAWTAMISGICRSRRANEALELFSRMQKDGVEPNQVTFVGVLNACSHAGLVHEGRKYFEMMTNIHGISPSTEHFACMVDILGRAGHIEEAYKLITDTWV
ncbi:hypothetical protein GIB67_006023, partial [Kingdonia uniflora]